jgi:hypothetical protein
MEPFVKAEKQGKEVRECFPYFKNCPKSIFRSSSFSSNFQKTEDPVTLNSGHQQSM